MAEAEREQEEEDLAELKQIEEDDLKRRAEGIKLIERAKVEEDKKEKNNGEGGSSNGGKKKSSKDRFKEREVSELSVTVWRQRKGGREEEREGRVEWCFFKGAQLLSRGVGLLGQAVGSFPSRSVWV